MTLVKTDDGDPVSAPKEPADWYSQTVSDVERKISEQSKRCAMVHNTAQSDMILASSALLNLKTERKASGTRKAGVEIQKMLSSLGIFLQGFSGIAEIVKAADQQFGGLAYGTVSVLVTVAVRKVEHEDLIEEVLEELAHAFPRLNVLEHIEPRDNLRALLVGAFEMTIQMNLTTHIHNPQQEALKEEHIKAELHRGMEKQLVPNEDGTLYFMGRIWVPLFGGVREIIFL